MNSPVRLGSVLLVAMLLSCGGGSTVNLDASVPDAQDSHTSGDASDARIAPDLEPEPADLLDLGSEPSDGEGSDTGTNCAPGEGCFLDPCEGNDDCLSGWCVGHMGENVCTVQCQSECPQGWACQQVPGTLPDIVWICVSPHANLCLPCSTGADCKGAAGVDDVCVDYGDEGSFCGGSCLSDEECPWGFSCGEAFTVNGVSTMQCVADAGVCPCTKKSVELALFTPCEVENEFGACAGKRVCTDEGLLDCDAPLPSDEVCNGIDDNCDGDVDEETCDDGNECTEDACGGEGGCSHLPLDAVECKDGDPCTVADHCEQGVCVGDPVLCDDDNPCTDDLCTPQGGCEFPPVFGSCDDGDPCTVADQCADGDCQGTPVSCECEVDADCAALEDGNLCNGTLFCDLEKLPYLCRAKPGTEVACPEPEPGPDAICLKASCDPATGACSLVADHGGYPCEDGDLCTLGDTCADGICTPGKPPLCNDGNPCTIDSCDPATGCAHGNSNDVCSDGNVCTLGDQCADGECQPGAESLDCDDGNPCTTDTCDPAAGCVHGNSNEVCDDGNACTTGDVCANGTCTFDAFLDCDDGNPCTTDSCDPQSGCVYKMNQAPCDDGDLCTTGDHCHLGECIGAGTLSCNDGNLCTDDSCNANSGCTFVNNEVPCDDGNACTVDDQCAGGWCKAGDPLDCDDGNVCTTDTCDPATGCAHGNTNGECDDGNACTVGDQCGGGTCQPGTGSLDCDDGNVCTTDSCNSATGCVHGNTTEECDDGNACTVGDQCGGGACQPGTEALDCDDSNPCTTDGCNPASGCTHDVLANETPCGAGKWCQAGICEDEPPSEVTFDTLNFNGMTGWPLKFDNTPYCQPTTDQQQMDALCQLAGYDEATDWVYESKYINNCYCWGSCSGFVWQSNCCGGWQTQIMVTQVTCI